MQKISIAEELRGNAYPGRGIIIGRTEDGTKAVTVKTIEMSFSFFPMAALRITVNTTIAAAFHSATIKIGTTS